VIFLILIFVLLLVWLKNNDQKSGSTARRVNAPPRPHQPSAQLPTETKAERLAALDAFHANELNALEVAIAGCAINWSDFSEAKHAIQNKTQKGQVNLPSFHRGADIGFAVGNAMNAAVFRRQAARALQDVILKKTLRDLDDADRAVLRLADILSVLGTIDQTTLCRIRATIIWSGGKCLTNYQRQLSASDRTAYDSGLQILMSSNLGDRTMAHEAVQEALRRSLSPESSLAEEDRRILEQYLFAGSRWLAPAEVAAPMSPYALTLGTFEGTDRTYAYERRESLITIAPPGSGKSQAHVIPNLLSMRAPAVVLDIKTEAFKKTARWRKENVGSIFAFAPGMPNATNHYNPLDGIKSGDDTWDDARKLADLLVIPNNSDSYFENRGRDMLTTILLDVALNEPPELRNMNAVLDRLYLSPEEFEAWISELRDSEVPMLRRQSNALRSMPNKQKEAIIESARNHLECWQSPTLSRITQRSDFHPDMLRNENGTLYLCIQLEDMKKYAPVLRVILGQTIAALCKTEAEAKVPLVTFFLDEFPRLGHMDVIEEGLDYARGHGVRFWMFCQNYGQLKTAYHNAEGILGNCAIRCYMDPDDDTAEELSRYLGDRKGLIDGKKKPLAEATELKGPEFADKVIVFQRGKPPAKLVRRMAFETRLQAAE
jgi:type IV secretion system protein VirD4